MDQMCCARQQIETILKNQYEKREAMAAVVAANINTYFHGQDGFSINYPYIRVALKI